MQEVGHTITVVNKSGKVVATSKHLMNVFKEAKNAYRERKAEIVAERQGRLDDHRAKRVEVTTVTDESRSTYSDHVHTNKHLSKHHRAPESRVRSPPDRSTAHSSARSTTSSRRSTKSSPQVPIRSSSRSVVSAPSRSGMAMTRRHTSQEMDLPQHKRKAPQRANTTTGVDMDLAYGSAHPSSLRNYKPQKPEATEMSTLVSKVKALLEEADCARASVTAMISHLQKNPEAMAAVALTLAEISNLAMKMAPGALTTLKGSAPAVFALLASPEFLIAAGVGIGITIVAFGGYKIIKKLKGKNEKEGDQMDEMVELSDIELDRIEHWRRGIADAEVESGGTVVEGEFITPMAARLRRSVMSRRVPMAVPSRASSRSQAGDDKSSTTEKSRKHKHKSERVGSSAAGSSDLDKGKEKEKKSFKFRKPSPLRMMFK